MADRVQIRRFCVRWYASVIAAEPDMLSLYYVDSPGCGCATTCVDLPRLTGEPVVGATLIVDGTEYRQEREEILEVVLGDLARQIEPLR